jgi:TolB-like protein/Tfp pilus assembly protein PilF
MQQDETLTFGRFELRRRRRELLADGEPIELGSRGFDILLALIDAGGAVVAKSELMDLGWPGTAVEENNLSVQIHALRRALGEDRRMIVTIAGRGYRFAGELRAGSTVPRLSIVVLPFTSWGDDREQQYFADGITEDLTTDLSRLADITVISRNTAFRYRNRLTETKLIGRELGVRYVLGGSVQRSGNRVRVSVQLIYAETDAILWADRLESDADDLFAIQNEITGRIGVALNAELVGAEVSRSTDQPDVLDYVLRARALYLGNAPTRSIYTQQIALYERAQALDPGSRKVQGFLAWQLAARVLDQMTDSADSDIARAETLANRALAAVPTTALAHFAKAQVLRAQQRFEQAIAEYETVLSLNRNWVEAIAALGHCKMMAGSIEETIAAQERAIRLSPRDPKIWSYYFWTGQAHLLQSRVDEAIPWLEKACSANPEHPLPHAYLASAHALKGAGERAAAELELARKLCADDRYSSIARLKAVGPFGAPKISALFEATYLIGLRKAGLPD